MKPNKYRLNIVVWTFAIFMMALSACTTKEIIYQNQTTVKEVVREVTITEYINITPKCKVCPVLNKSYKNKYLQCQIALDYQDDVLFECLTNSSYERVDNLTERYDDCEKELNECENKLNNISEMI
jgi:hypothetical protein